MSSDTIVQYVVNFLAMSDMHPTVVNRFTKSAELLRSKNDVEKWLKTVKNKIGRPKYLEMKKSFETYVKKDVGFETMHEDDIVCIYNTCQIILNI